MTRSVRIRYARYHSTTMWEDSSHSNQPTTFIFALFYHKYI
uniref:Uncharacterized protein n=1 Tax=Ciona intestinalis TaxID=7719 RepID=H2Y227_CIOIN